ncbi:MAG: cyclic nucleotide-binding domain-containing protein, partial [Enterobacteriaceae bacterium]
KYEGERLCLKYRDLGVNTSIYRVGNQSIHSTRYHNQENIEDNAFFNCVSSMLNLGLIAKEVALFEISPVDCTADAVIKLFRCKGSAQGIWHVFNPNLCDLAALFASDTALCSLQQVSIMEFIQQLQQKLPCSTYRHYIELFMLHAGWLGQLDQQPETHITVKQSQTAALLQALEFEWPQIELQMFSDLLLQAFRERCQLLTRSPVMNQLSPEMLLQLAKAMRLVHHAEESLLSQENQTDEALKFILQGFAELFVTSDGGWVSTLHLLSADDVINLESLQGLQSGSSARALFDAVSTLEIDREKLEQLLQANPWFYQNVIRYLLGWQKNIQQMYACLR